MWANDETGEAFDLKTGRRVASEIDEDVADKADTWIVLSCVPAGAFFFFILFSF